MREKYISSEFNIIERASSPFGGNHNIFSNMKSYIIYLLSVQSAPHIVYPTVYADCIPAAGLC